MAKINSFKKRTVILLSIIFVLAVLYTGTFIFGSGESFARNSIYTWLDSRFVSYVDKIEIYGPAGQIILQRKNNIWVITGTGEDYPVKQARPADLLSDLSRPGDYPVRSTAAAMQDVYGVGSNATRIIVRGGAGLPLLDLLIGNTDLTGGIFLRKTGQSEIRSGKDIFTVYTDNEKTFWYDLRIFPGLSADLVQRIRLTDGEKTTSITRDKNNWITENTGAVFDNAASYLRLLLEAEAENFIDAAEWEIQKTINVELGNGSSITVNIGPPDSRELCPARIVGSDLFYSISERTVNRIFSVL